MQPKKQIAILGRQPAISIAELESLFGANLITPVGDYAVLVNSIYSLPQDRLGGTMKSAEVMCELKNSNVGLAFDYLNKNLSEVFNNLTDGKLKLGFSIYGFEIKKETLLKHTLTVKKSLKKTGQSVRIIENKTPEMSSAQVLYNKLTDEMGREILVIKDKSNVIIAQTTAVQDIDAYGERDFGRPKRDAKVGMLPPKLAQIIINLAVGQTKQSQNLTILDPFCGTGVVLQEAELMGFSTYGSDLEPRMVEYSQINMKWLASKWKLTNDKWKIIQADATDYNWQPEPNFIACETYLGRPFSAMPGPQVIQKVMQDVDTIHKKFLTNIANQTKPGFKMCIAVPAWNTPHGFKHLKTLDHLKGLGYTRLVFEHTKTSELIYYRPNQIVARELVILVRN